MSNKVAFPPIHACLLMVGIILSACSLQTPRQTAAPATSNSSLSTGQERALDKLKKKYDTLLPIFNDQLFITHNKQKWGVIDMNGRQIVPFICDGIRTISDSTGIAAIYTSSYSLNTGIPRYQYCGKYFYFTKNGSNSNYEKDFGLLIELVADYHREEFILYSPEKYVPYDTIHNKPCSGFFFQGK